VCPSYIQDARFLKVKLQIDTRSNQFNNEDKSNTKIIMSTWPIKLKHTTLSTVLHLTVRNLTVFKCPHTPREVVIQPHSLVWSRIQSLTHNPFKTSHVNEKFMLNCSSSWYIPEPCIRAVHPSITFVPLLWLVTEVKATRKRGKGKAKKNKTTVKYKK
jgi:hypothetical protein